MARHNRLIRGLTLIVAFSAVTGCAALRSTGTIPEYPQAEDLENDGSERDQKHLMKEYSIRIDDSATRLGEAVRGRESFTGRLHPQMVTYLEQDPAANKILPSKASRLIALILARGGGALCAMSLLGSIFLFTAFIGIPLAIVGLVLMIAGTVMLYTQAADEAAAVDAYNKSLKRRISKAGKRE